MCAKQRHKGHFLRIFIAIKNVLLQIFLKKSPVSGCKLAAAELKANNDDCYIGEILSGWWDRCEIVHELISEDKKGAYTESISISP
jgi:hypothetical protein